MNTNPDAIRILCYGDSNTWGDDPHIGAARYPVNVRWTGKLQELLGTDYEIIEEGLCGRTTILDDPKEEGRNGKAYLTPCLLTHNPIDVVILLLGTNDLKERFNLTAEEIADNVGELIRIINEVGLDKKDQTPQIILLSPTTVNEHTEIAMEGMKGAQEKSKQFAKYYQKIAEKRGCEFLDLAEFVEPSKIDSCHLDIESHEVIANLLSEKIRVSI